MSRPTATIRDLRNHFSKVKKLVEAEGEVLVTDNGEPKYRLVLYTATVARKAPAAKDYMARLKRFQPRPVSVGTAESLQDENRGER